MTNKENMRQQMQEIISAFPPSDVWDLERDYGVNIKGTKNFLAAEKMLEEWKKRYTEYLCFIANVVYKA